MDITKMLSKHTIPAKAGIRPAASAATYGTRSVHGSRTHIKVA